MFKRRWDNFVYDRTTPPIVGSKGGQLYLEKGALDALSGCQKVAIIASWSRDRQMSLSLSWYLFELESCGFATVVVSSAEVPSPLEWPHGIPADTLVVRRRNIGHDFGSWAAALHALPGVAKAQHVLLTNDSMLGPFQPLDSLINRATSSNAGVVALTDSYQIGHSLQSYFMLFNHGILSAPEWVYFFNSVRHQKQKMDVVFRYELKVAVVAVRGGFGWEVLYPAQMVGAGERNVTLGHWQDLLDLGFPFVKRTLWVEDELRAEAQLATVYLKGRFGVNAERWMPEIDASPSLLPPFEVSTEPRIETEP